MKVYFNNNINRLKESKEMDEYCVLVRFKTIPNLIRITYKTSKSPTIINIEELNEKEDVIVGCRFKGRKTIGDHIACPWMMDIKKAIQGIKPNDWILHNKDLFVDSYFKIH